jgi:hypothetical protein
MFRTLTLSVKLERATNHERPDVDVETLKPEAVKLNEDSALQTFLRMVCS